MDQGPTLTALFELNDLFKDLISKDSLMEVLEVGTEANQFGCSVEAVHTANGPSLFQPQLLLLWNGRHFRWALPFGNEFQG